MDRLGSENFIRVLLAIVLSTAFILSGISAYKAMTKRTTEQKTINENVNRWKQSYKALQVVVKEWNATYSSGSSRLDDLALIKLIDLPGAGLRADTDYLVIVSNPQVTSKNIDVGLTKICLGVKGETFVVSAPTYTELLNGIDRLAARADLTINTITIAGDATYPTANLGGFCVLIRNEVQKI